MHGKDTEAQQSTNELAILLLQTQDVEIPPVAKHSYNVALIHNRFRYLLNNANTIDALGSLEGTIERELKRLEQDRRATSFHSTETVKAAFLETVSDEYETDRRLALAEDILNHWRQDEKDRQLLEAWFENLRGEIRRKKQQPNIRGQSEIGKVAESNQDNVEFRTVTAVARSVYPMVKKGTPIPEVAASCFRSGKPKPMYSLKSDKDYTEADLQDRLRKIRDGKLPEF